MIENSENSRELDELRLRKRAGFHGFIPPILSIIRGADAQASVNFSTPFFVADRPYEVYGFSERHEVAATDGAIMLRRVPNGTAPASGTAVLSSSVSLAAAANTLQEGEIIRTAAKLAKDEALSLEATGLLTSLQGVTAVVFLKAI